MKRLLCAALLLLSCLATAAAAGPVPADRLERWLESRAERVEPTAGGWLATVDGVEVQVFAHPDHDRMRILAPVVPVASLPVGGLETLLAANYARALDARYAVERGVVWSLFVHSLSLLTRDELASGLEQVVALRRNYGTSFASTELAFGDPSAPQEPAPAARGDSPPDSAVWSMAGLAAERARTGRPYHEFLRAASTSAGLYALAAGAADPQGPHDRDEIYYVVAGRATLEAGAERHSLAPGAVAYVRAGVEHRFVDVEEDLRVLVVFAGSKPAG